MGSRFRHEIPLDAKIYIAGHAGLAGSAIWRAFEAEGYHHLVGRRSAELDLSDATATNDFFAEEKPDYVIDCAARVGGMFGNDAAPADFLADNLRIQLNIFDAVRRFTPKRTLFLGSSCIYPKFAQQPIREDALMTGPLEETNYGYAVAKIAGVTQVQALRQQDGLSVISAMPTNLYGPGDNFNIPGAHAFPMIMRRLHEAKLAGDDEFVVYGTGTPLREFLHSDDLGRAVIALLRRYDEAGPINVGSGHEVSINDLAGRMAREIGYEGTIVNDPSKPDGTPRKLLDNSRIFALDWKPEVSLETGIAATYRWFLEHEQTFRR